MKRIEELIDSIKGNIKNEIKDHSILSQLNKQLQQTHITPDLVSKFTKSVFSLYDLSNHHTLVQRIAVKNSPVKFQHDPLAIMMKLTVFKMLVSLVIFYTDNPNAQLPLPLLRESLQIMILIARVFIDLGQSSQIKSLYSFVNVFHQGTSTGISIQIEMLHLVNIIQLMRIDIDRSQLDVYQFKKIAQIFFDLTKKVTTSAHYVQLVQYIILEVILKLIKIGNSDKCKILKSFLPEKMLEILNSVTNFESRLLEGDFSQLKISPFFELFLSLKQGKQQISQQRLRTFIQSGQNYKDPRIFDVVALTGNHLPLEIWFQTYINTKQKCENISNAYKCFNYLIDKYFCSYSSPQLSISHQHTVNELSSYIKISQLVMLGLLLQKKETQQPIIYILKRIMKVMIHCVINLYPSQKDVKEFGDKSLLICGKFALGDLAKSINCIMFYYEILMGSANQQSYNKFYKSNLMQKSNMIFKTIKLAYEIRSNKSNLTSNDMDIIKREPYLAVLFQKQLKENIILSIESQNFSTMNEKFQIYFMLVSNLQLDVAEQDLAKLSSHMEETLIRIDLTQINKLDLRYISMISNILLKFLQARKEKVSKQVLCRFNITLFYLISLKYFSSEMATLNIGILLNRYSKLMKILSFSFQLMNHLSENQRNQCCEKYLYLSKSMLCWSLQHLKIINHSNMTVIEAGSLALYDQLNNFVFHHEKIPQSIEFIRFVRFQISCITDTVSDNEISLQKNLKLLKLFCSSRWIKKSVKLKILRKLIKQDLISQSRQITLQDLNDLILLSENPKESKMYAEYLLKLFGQQGRTYLYLQSASNPKAYEFLTILDQNEEDDNIF